MPNLVECAKYAHCQYRANVGSCPESCYQFKHKDERRVVFCEVCAYRDHCNRTAVIEIDDPDEHRTIWRHRRLEYCSAGKIMEE